MKLRTWKLKSANIVPVIIGAMGVTKKNLTEILKTTPREHYHKQTTIGGCLGLSDDPEKNSRNKTLRIRKLHNLFLETCSYKNRKWLL